MHAPVILLVSLIILCRLLCGVSSQYCKRPDPSRPKKVSDQITECEEAVAALDSAEQGSCAAPDSMVERKSQLIKSAMKREIQRLKKIDPQLPLMHQIAQIEAHHALLAAYENLRRRRELMGNVKPRKSKFAKNAELEEVREKPQKEQFVGQERLENEYEYYEEEDYYPHMDRVNGGNPNIGWPMMKDL